MDLASNRVEVELRREPMGEDGDPPLPRRLDPQAAAGEAGVTVGVGSQVRSTRALGALPCPADREGTAACKRPGDTRAGQNAFGAEPLSPQGQHLLRRHEQARMAGEAAHRACVSVLNDAAQEGRLARELDSLAGGELDLLAVVEPALDGLLWRRMPGERAERSEAKGSRYVQIEEIGQAPTTDRFRCQSPEDVSQIAVRGGLAACVARAHPKALGQQELRELRSLGETLSQAGGERCPGGDPRPVTQEVLERRSADPGAGSRKDRAQGGVEVELPLRRQRQGEGGHPGLGERGGIEAGARLQGLTAHPVAGDVAPPNLRRIGDQDFDRADRASEPGKAVQVFCERVRLTVGHRNRILP